MTWVSLGLNIDGVEIFGRLDDDGKMRVTCIADHPELVAWIADGNTPEPWPPNE